MRRITSVGKLEKVFNFTITLWGRGTTPKEAWEDVKTTFIDADPDAGICVDVGVGRKLSMRRKTSVGKLRAGETILLPDEKVFDFAFTLRGRGTTLKEAWEDAKPPFIAADPDAALLVGVGVGRPVNFLESYLEEEEENLERLP